MRTAQAQGVRFVTEQEWFTAAEGWQPSDPFPLVEGPALRRYEELLAPAPLPPVQRLAWPGVVVSCGSRRSEVVGGLLAEATGRDRLHVAPEEMPAALARLGDSYVALVGLLTDLDAIGDWPASWHARVGVVTARDLPALVALVYRTLTVAAAAGPGVGRLVHPVMPGASRADVTSIDEIDALTTRGHGLLVLNSHGRECCVHLPDGVVCGRSDAPSDAAPPDGAAPPGVRTPSCLRGGGCFRPELSPSQRVPASSLRGTVVLAHACDAIAFGVNALPHRVSVTLGLLEGNAVAVLGAVGRHEPDPGTSERMLSGIARGLRPGDVLRELNAMAAGGTGELTRFGLLGDPSLALPATLVAAAAQDLTATAPATSGGGGGQPDGSAAAADLLTLGEHVIPAIESLPWFDVPIPEPALAALAHRVRHLWAGLQGGVPSTSLATAVAACHEELASLQARIVDDFLDTVHTTWWQFGESAVAGLRQTAALPAPCPHCGRRSAEELQFRHGLRASATLGVHFCLRCGPTRWRTGEVPGLHQATRADLLAHDGRAMALPLTLRNDRPQPVSVAVGFAFANGSYHRLPAPQSWTVRLGPGETRVVTADGRMGTPRAYDMFEGVFVTCVDGLVTVLPTWVTVAVEPSGTPISQATENSQDSHVRD
ncbi:hypothetical protein [Micromonospora maritima]|uniref:hypothetical protein n=1 Tax=Micromonospora maritima TaxID=986711 RepID=UPI00157CF435|nr:hypothetical protein [Micromonospora maritima]